ncbi:MAG: hypothetical protein IT369_16075 [Candidatus Latescibacteria bacterium]|nr:hypothetical protein [Candidatus Latescibacterota bacterium]
MRNYHGFPEYVPVAQKRAKAARKLQDLKKKNPSIQPVVLEGNTLARTWWGKSWNENLERYADYYNRIDRGRSYVRHGAVLDLKIAPGKVRALVQGSQRQPYKIEISIAALDQKTWARLRKSTAGQLDSLADLLAGKFPQPLQELFFAKGGGLFPEPKEIDFDCSCPDWASMCKHVAATLYGIGARLDENPSLFFELRKIEVDELITQAVQRTTRTLLAKARTRKTKVIADTDITAVFGIELEDQGKAPQGRARRKKERSTKPVRKPAVPKKPVVGKTGTPMRPAATKAAKATIPGKRSAKATAPRRKTRTKAPAKAAQKPGRR